MADVSIIRGIQDYNVIGWSRTFGPVHLPGGECGAGAARVEGSAQRERCGTVMLISDMASARPGGEARAAGHSLLPI